MHLSPQPSRTEQMCDLRQIAPDEYEGAVVPSSLGRTFGGQHVAQALAAAGATVDPEFLPHSLHCYFLAPGDPSQPSVLKVQRLREGRSFHSRMVSLSQAGQLLCSMQVSFHHVADSGISHHQSAPPLPAPEEITPAESRRAAFFDREWPEWDIRVLSRERLDDQLRHAATQVVWMRCTAGTGGDTRVQLPDNELFHRCALAYISDATLLSSAQVRHPDTALQMASLDHALWFLRPVRVDEWLAYVQTSPAAGAGRSLCEGRIYDQAGQLVAVAAQEGLTRHLRQ
ncbi:Acyl-CoA thioesterase 2 [Corynebacterium ciconiae DSM 44920]|uniref:acyl-CoA thioesterase n=1 Tax=Corynebacterium ciconiae TaxID=227319 RepID=UPI00039DD574|nr:acyl-CoA thioesterase domain-containing protein [Corynebacterium ciconiae]WKD61341.1 Acyl-CoA thioesterase 2 [Corynebacterium ciconiae DSM 44920]